MTTHAFRLRRGRILWPLGWERGERLPAGAVVIGTWHTPGLVLDVVEVVLDGRPRPVRGYLAGTDLAADLEPVGDIRLAGQADVRKAPSSSKRQGGGGEAA